MAKVADPSRLQTFIDSFEGQKMNKNVDCYAMLGTESYCKLCPEGPLLFAMVPGLGWNPASAFSGKRRKV